MPYTQAGAVALTNLRTSMEKFRMLNGDYTPSALTLMHDLFTYTAVPDIVAYFRSLNFKFLTVSECIERCITRAYPDQPTWEADYRGCIDPRNPTTYNAGSVLLGQWWLRMVHTTTLPFPPPLSAADLGPANPTVWVPTAVAVNATPTAVAGGPTAAPTFATNITATATATATPTATVIATNATGAPTTAQQEPTSDAATAADAGTLASYERSAVVALAALALAL